MNLIKNLFTIIFSLIVTLIFAEIIFRVFDIGYGNAPLEQSKIYHHAHPKNYSFLMHDPKGEYGGYKVFYDESGYRVSSLEDSNFLKKDNKNSIVFIGDSYTEANQVLYENSYVKKIGDYFKKNTLNLGVSSYSPAIYLIQVKRQIVKLKSNLVVLQVFRNDFSDDIKYLRNATYIDNKLIGIDGGEENYFTSVLRKSYLLRFLRKSQLLIGQLLQQNNQIINNNINTFYDDISDENLKKTSNLINEIKIELNKTNKKLAVFMVPDKTLSQNEQCCEKDTIYKRFKSEMNEKNIVFLDISKYFSDFPNQSKLFYLKDIHLTNTGHYILSKALIEEIQNHFLLK